MLLLVLFAALAMILSVVGLYGVISFLVGLRTREIGVRMAIGARPSDIARSFCGEALRFVSLGIGVGILGAYLVSRLMSDLVFEISPADPWSFVVAALLFGFVASIAGYFPARRASRIDPLVALREE